MVKNHWVIYKHDDGFFVISRLSRGNTGSVVLNNDLNHLVIFAACVSDDIYVTERKKGHSFHFCDAIKKYVKDYEEDLKSIQSPVDFFSRMKECYDLTLKGKGDYKGTSFSAGVVMRINNVSKIFCVSFLLDFVLCSEYTDAGYLDSISFKENKEIHFSLRGFLSKTSHSSGEECYNAFYQ